MLAAPDAIVQSSSEAHSIVAGSDAEIDSDLGAQGEARKWMTIAITLRPTIEELATSLVGQVCNPPLSPVPFYVVDGQFSNCRWCKHEPSAHQPGEAGAPPSMENIFRTNHGQYT